MKFLFPTLFGLVISTAQPAYPVSNLCETLWKPQVEQAQAALSKHGSHWPILFADMNGTVFDCLNLKLEKSLLTKIAAMSETLAKLHNKEALEEQRRPEYFCSMSAFNSLFNTRDSDHYMTIHLPSDEQTLLASDCQANLAELPIYVEACLMGVLVICR
ncbi:hypothetical protein J7443_13185 [Tropicibacter sp. R15_0]|uniref:hypothetical protein n=1 Tax=Tropicibacter sp. R15_0 TaxID=2821101 RepID=UPI001ADC80AE|nr:hypothetical protein [Tropicibacter sp. R15_0]MBO9466192.1 hypothetical protein [Tropicibacter sp. R15_0]